MAVSLREIQEKFKAYILNKSTDVLDTISTQNASSLDRINIYKQGYSLRLLEILEKDFPIFRLIVGETLFEQIGSEYINCYPSDHFSICIFSRHFSKFLLEANYDPHLSEMAAFEWALACALDAADAPQIGLDQLGTIVPESWPDVQFFFHPSVKLYQFNYNAPQIVYAHLTKQESIPELSCQETPRDWLIWRHQLNSYFESATQPQVWMVNAIHEGKTFAELCEGLCQWFAEEEVAQFAAGSLHNWLSKGMFSAIKVRAC